MKGQFWVIEGLDGCGKTTQLNLLQESLDKQGIEYKYIHFPMLNQGIYGNLIAEFLRGEFGSVENVHPKLVALLFANDRKEHIDKIINWLKDGYYVLADRYVYSNIAFQCAKLVDDEEKSILKKWILDFEFGRNNLPRPDKTLFLNVPFKFVQASLSQERTGNDRDYLNGKEDIHEKSMDLQKHVYAEYQKLVAEESDFTSIDCFNDSGLFRSREEIHQLILKELL